MKSKQGIIVSAYVMGLVFAGRSLIEHPAQRDAVDVSSMNTEADYRSVELIDDAGEPHDQV